MLELIAFIGLLVGILVLMVVIIKGQQSTSERHRSLSRLLWELQQQVLALENKHFQLMEEMLKLQNNSIQTEAKILDGIYDALLNEYFSSRDSVDSTSSSSSSSKGNTDKFVR
jgi:uncharacterized protein YoxC